MSFRIVNGPVEQPTEIEEDENGAAITFLGVVRNHNSGRSVAALEYEAFVELALSEGNKIIDEALARHEVTNIDAAHSVGNLKVGQPAFRVTVTAHHRDAAFSACRFVVDEIKRRVPIWKREHFADGSSEWLNGSGPANEAAIYERQITLPEVGENGQEKLRTARVLVVGAGGLGCPALQHLAAAGVGTIGVCEGDTLEVSNLHRQTLYEYAQVGRRKCGAVAERLRAFNPYIKVIEHDAFLVPENIATILSDYDYVLDCGDNFELTFLLNDHCVKSRKVLISASIHQFDGTMLVIRPEGPCLRCIWPQAPGPNCVANCADAGVLGFVPGTVGTLQAAEAIKEILGLDVLGSEMLTISFLPYAITRITVARNDDCPSCGSGVSTENHLQVSRIPEQSIIVDIRSAEESIGAPIGLPSITSENVDWADGQTYVLVCEQGVRSYELAQQLRDKGFANVYSFSGGKRKLDSLSK
jgi:adenylyltransferase/sulfurtransferase